MNNGKSFKTNILFQENKLSLQIVLYQDSFEVCNPIGSSKRKHKILAVCMSFANFPPHFRSSVENIQLVLLSKEKDFKYFGQKKIFKPLIHDLKKIEETGVSVCLNGKDTVVGNTLLHYW